MIKNIGNLNHKHLFNALSYTIKNAIEKTAFNEFFEPKSFKEILEEWKPDYMNAKENDKVGLHLVFSLKEAKSEKILELLQTAVYQTLKSNLTDYSFVLIPHSHQNNPHIHCIINKTNQTTGRKLHFISKSECREFYHQLREDFKNNLFYLSDGKLDYSNNPKIKLESIEEEIKAVQAQSNNLSRFDAESFYNSAFKDLNNRHQFLKKVDSEFQSDLQNLLAKRESLSLSIKKVLKTLRMKMPFNRSKKIFQEILF